jgi:metallophosphoesterase (TIGR00282 family)
MARDYRPSAARPADAASKYVLDMPPRRVLFIGDIVGEPGRTALTATLPSLIERYEPAFVIANGENVAGGLGITKRTAQKLFDAGIDVLTTGNHVYRHRDVYPFLDDNDRIVRPANYLESNPGRGYTVVEKDGVRWGVVNISGNVFMQAAHSAFNVIDRILSRLNDEADAIVVDFHAETTSEKVAMGWHLDGRVLAVLGTHTHVPTADGRVLPKGTAYVTDVGMTGARGGVIGVKREQIIERFVTQLPVRFETAEEDPWVMGCAIDVREDGLASAFEQVMVPAEG